MLQRLIIGLLCVALTACSSNDAPRTSSNTLRIAFDDDPNSLDPRLLRDISGVTVVHMLFEGLMKRDLDGKLVPGAAKGFSISDDRTVYTFDLRDSVWSNGDPVTAEDFVYAWQSVLSPTLPSPNAYQLFVIKNGKAVKDGKLSADQLGVKAAGHRTLVVELEHPVPYFLELLDFHPFFPVNSKHVAAQPTWAQGNPKLLVNNGPYLLENWQHRDILTLKKNPSYWDQENVLLEHVHAYMVDSQTALHMLEKGEVDWVGSPCGSIPLDMVPGLQQAGTLSIANGAGTRLLRLNTASAPLNNKKLRQALSYALNREQLTKHVTHGIQKPATSLIPPAIFAAGGPCFEDHNVAKAKKLFAEALTEMHLTADQLPTITLIYAQNHMEKIAEAIQQQLKEGLGITIALVAQENKIFFDNLSRKQYQMALGSWIADFQDPTNFLDLFKYKSNGTNNTEWENARYVQLLSEAENAEDEEKRNEALRKAEELLIDETPVVPIAFTAFTYVKRDGVQNVYFSPLGYLDVRQAVDKESLENK